VARAALRGRLEPVQEVLTEPDYGTRLRHPVLRRVMHDTRPPADMQQSKVRNAPEECAGGATRDGIAVWTTTLT
jgi:hypothetical protein